jgi:hypothetical protein
VVRFGAIRFVVVGSVVVGAVVVRFVVVGEAAVVGRRAAAVALITRAIGPARARAAGQSLAAAAVGVVAGLVAGAGLGPAPGSGSGSGSALGAASEPRWPHPIRSPAETPLRMSRYAAARSRSRRSRGNAPESLYWRARAPRWA